MMSKEFVVYRSISSGDYAAEITGRRPDGTVDIAVIIPGADERLPLTRIKPERILAAGLSSSPSASSVLA